MRLRGASPTSFRGSLLGRLTWESHHFTTTGQIATGTANSAKWNVKGSWTNGWNYYTTKLKNGGTLYFPENGNYEVSGDYIEVGTRTQMALSILGKVGQTRILSCYEEGIWPAYSHPMARAWELRAVHD